MENVTATVTNAVTTEATCEVDGVRTYTAKVTFGGKEYTDTKTETPRYRPCLWRAGVEVER
ncbi:MAG: hypothetical protein V8S77_02495 [Oscillospiraceae bacterium]